LQTADNFAVILNKVKDLASELMDSCKMAKKCTADLKIPINLYRNVMLANAILSILLFVPL